MLVAFNAYLAILTGPLQSIGAYIVMLQRAVVSCYRLSSIMERRTSVPEPAIASPLPPGPGAVRLDRVKFSYPGVVDGSPVLDGFELSIDGGEVVAMVGATGSGKTTVLSLLARLYDPTEGVVYLDGVDVSSLGLATVRRAVAVVFEDSFLFNDTTEANLKVGRPDATDQELAEAAHLAQADEFIDELPQGYKTPVGERGLALSGGQRQRLALARALLADPRVLVLDDATSAVDAPRELQVVKALAEARRGRTTLIISHRPATIAVADRVVLIDGGRVVAQGTHEQLRATTPLYRHVLGIESVPGEEQSVRT
jgi:ATP-binding cassette subfamily B protein